MCHLQPGYGGAPRLHETCVVYESICSKCNQGAKAKGELKTQAEGAPSLYVGESSSSVLDDDIHSTNQTTSTSKVEIVSEDGGCNRSCQKDRDNMKDEEPSTILQEDPNITRDQRDQIWIIETETENF